MSLAANSSVGPYEIVAPIGAGGMGEVYRAKDTRLDRQVAIKVLPSGMAHDPERLARFEREAKVLAALNHPHIAHIYGLEQSGDVRALVMELIEGAPLATPQPLERALRYARQIAEALEAAHEKGITHRDLKPGNIMVSSDGTVKVLDFGLASAPAAEAGANPANSPTITMAAATQMGVILGTAAYMSPEQASGQPVDKRSDIWSFGVVLYEMLSGARMFEGETISHTLAHVLTAPIDLGKLPKNTPPQIAELLLRCLDRDPRTRLRDIGEARVAIDRYLADPKAPTNAANGANAGRTRALAPWLVAAVALVSTGALAWKYFQPADAPVSAVRFNIPLPPKSSGMGPGLGAFSPDGRSLAFVIGSDPTTASQLWIRPLDSTNLRMVPGASGAFFPFFSPDGRFVAFWTSNGLQKIPVEGGAPITVTTARPFGGTWNREGVILIGSDSGPILRVPENGGDAVPALPLDKSRQETSQLWPQFLPDGRRFLYFSRARNGGIFLAQLGSSQSRHVVDSESQASYAAGHLLFVRAQALLAQRFDLSSGAVTGAPFPVAEKIDYVPEISDAAFAFSPTGSVAYRPGGDVTSVVAVLNRRGERTGVAGPPGDYGQLTLSPDEKRLAIDRREKGNFDIWMLELGTGVFSRVTFDPANDRDPVFSPDGRQIVFTNSRLGMPHLYRKTIGGGPEELIYRGPDREASEAWLKDGSILFGNVGGHKYFLLRPGEGEPKLIYQSDFQVDEPAISPDGKWVAYGSRESGPWQAYVARFPQWDEQRQISTDTGMEPHWRADGREIVYITSDGKLMSVSVKPGAAFEASPPALLFNTGLRGSGTVEQWTMSHDASRFYVLTRVQEGDTPITVALNWLPTARK